MWLLKWQWTGSKTLPWICLWHDMAKQECPHLYGSWMTGGQLQLTCRCWPLRGTHWPPAPSSFCQELAWNRGADGSGGMEAFSWRTPDQIQLSREWSGIIHAAFPSDGCKIERNTTGVHSYPEVTGAVGASRDSATSPLFPLEQQCSGRFVERRLLPSYSFTITPLELCGWGSKSALKYTSK